MTDSTPTVALIDLLRSLFSEQELRAFVAHRVPHGERLADLLPGSPCTFDHLVNETSRILKRQGLVTPELFALLVDGFPGRRSDIERVAAAWKHPTANPAATLTTDSPPPTGENVSENAWDVFISHAKADSAWVIRLAEDLHLHGLRVFIDEWEIGAGDVVVHRLGEGLRASRNGILVVSPAAMACPWVMEEYAALLTRAVASKLRLIPVLYADADLPPMLATRAWIDLRGKIGDEYRELVRRLAQALKGQRPGPPIR